jgi:hypothetical protein
MARRWFVEPDTAGPIPVSYPASGVSLGSTTRAAAATRNRAVYDEAGSSVGELEGSPRESDDPALRTVPKGDRCTEKAQEPERAFPTWTI